MTLAPRIVAACVAFWIGLVAATAAEAKTAVVYLKDRQAPVTGELVGENAEQVIIRVAGIATPYDRAMIDRIEWKLSPAEQFADKRAKIKDENIVGRYNLAEWAYKQDNANLDELAKEELAALLAAKPDVIEAKILLRLVEDQIAKRADAATPTPPNGGGNTGAATPTTDPNAPALPSKTLSDDDRALLKVMLVDLSTKPRLMISNKVLDQFLKDFRDHPALALYQGRNGRAAFMRLQPHEQLGVIFEAKARAIYPQVQVRTEPAPLEEFRIKWNPHLVVRHFMRYFPEQSRQIYLQDKPANGEATAYTNLLMLHRASIDGKRLLNANQPRQSLLLQWGLPREEATSPAPDVPGYRPYFNGMQDPRVAEFEKWVAGFYRYGESFPIDFQPPQAAEPEPAPEPGKGG